MVKLKHDLRALVKAHPGWDELLTRDEQKLWIKNELQSLSNGADLAEKGYHSLTATKPKENVVFLKALDGVLGSNVYKFRKEIEKAIESTQVKEDDKVKMLRKYLTEDAKNDRSVKTTEEIQVAAGDGHMTRIPAYSMRTAKVKSSSEKKD